MADPAFPCQRWFGGPRTLSLMLHGRMFMFPIRPAVRAAFTVLIIVLAASTSFAYQQFEFVNERGEAGKKAPQRLLNEPRALALAVDRIYIADSDEHRVVVLDLSGQVIQSWGKEGDQEGQFKYPSGI